MMKFRKMKKLKLNNQGMTIVEVLMGFVILSLILDAVITMIMFSNNMMYKSVDLKNAHEEMERNLCIKHGETTSTDFSSNPMGSVNLSLKIKEVPNSSMIPGTGDSFSLNHGVLYKNQLTFGEKKDMELTVYTVRCE